MYRFSRCIYRELAPHVEDRGDVATSQARHKLLESAEATMRRLAADRRHFARPTRTLFEEVREHFALAEQVRVYMVIERFVDLAVDHLERLPDDVSLDGKPRSCLASTRKGAPCRREPLPGRDYCPSHKHLEEQTDSLGAGIAA